MSTIPTGPAEPVRGLELARGESVSYVSDWMDAYVLYGVCTRARGHMIFGMS